MRQVVALRPVAGVLLVLILSACAPAPGGPSRSAAGTGEASNGPVQASSTSGPFVLMLQASRRTWNANEPIGLMASLVYQGDRETITLAGSGSGLVSFGIKELGGKREVTGVQTSDCYPYELHRFVPVTSD